MHIAVYEHIRFILYANATALADQNQTQILNDASAKMCFFIANTLKKIKQVKAATFQYENALYTNAARVIAIYRVCVYVFCVHDLSG